LTLGNTFQTLKNHFKEVGCLCLSDFGTLKKEITGNGAKLHRVATLKKETKHNETLSAKGKNKQKPAFRLCFKTLENLIS